MSKLFDAFRKDISDVLHDEAEKLERERNQKLEAERIARDQKLKNERKNLRDCFYRETWDRLEKLGGAFIEGTAEYKVGNDIFFCYESTSTSSQSGYETILCIKNSQSNGQSVTLSDNGRANDQAIAKTLSIIYRDQL